LNLRAANFILLFSLVSSCASYTDETKQIRSQYDNRNFQTALKTIDESVLKDQDRNRLLYLMEKAMILDRLGEREKSRKLLLEADLLSDKLMTMSISKEALTYIYNESAQDYRGEDYEKVAIHTMLALSFLQDQQLNEARIEAARINTKLAELNARYDTSKNRYSEDAFARYLSGIIYEARGEIDSAIIDYNSSLNTYENVYEKYFGTSAPDNLVASLYRLLVKRRRTDRMKVLEGKYPKITASIPKNVNDKTGELVVVHEASIIAVKVAQEFMVPTPQGVARISFPIIYVNKGKLFGETGFQVAGPTTANVDGELAQFMDSVAHETLDDRRARLILKTIGRLATKTALTDQAYRNFGVIGGLATNIYSAISETADTRGWTLLPSGFFVTRKRLPPGKYDLTIKTRGKINEIKSVEIQSDKVVVLRAIGE
jgi:hypothetical protein